MKKLRFYRNAFRLSAICCALWIGTSSPYLSAEDVQRLPGANVPVTTEIVGPNCAFSGEYSISVTKAYTAGDKPYCRISVSKFAKVITHEPFRDGTCSNDILHQKCVDLCESDKNCQIQLSNFKWNRGAYEPVAEAYYAWTKPEDCYLAGGSLPAGAKIVTVDGETITETNVSVEESLYGPLRPAVGDTAIKRIYSTYPSVAYVNFPLKPEIISCQGVPTPSSLTCPNAFDDVVTTTHRTACRILPNYLHLYKDPLAAQPIANPDAPTTGNHFVAVDRKFNSSDRLESATHTCRYSYDCRTSFVVRPWNPQPVFDYIFDPKTERLSYHGSYCRAYGGWSTTVGQAMCGEFEKTLPAVIFAAENQKYTVDVFSETYVPRVSQEPYFDFTARVQKRCDERTGAAGADKTSLEYTVRQVVESYAASKCYEYATKVIQDEPTLYFPSAYVACCQTKVAR